VPYFEVPVVSYFKVPVQEWQEVLQSAAVPAVPLLFSILPGILCNGDLPF